ncbi:hypothetical protein PPERSA_00393 [Pseudocohnilembus persalinus]|uniref:Uncharacterized protein n=1 Tax=Pseudocohnilembus persalinus TaxID=266149 RepID=A0A0V0QYE4_PSEPJ|nr:hypothetical protein PPERSA_00393 [Pseudocohnilembus persalinus]|eukprot:KRX07236.1 hypothetical protein PPERSA_00393 [Pseudocohnilembus persalinus]
MNKISFVKNISNSCAHFTQQQQQQQQFVFLKNKGGKMYSFKIDFNAQQIVPNIYNVYNDNQQKKQCEFQNQTEYQNLDLFLNNYKPKKYQYTHNQCNDNLFENSLTDGQRQKMQKKQYNIQNDLMMLNMMAQKFQKKNQVKVQSLRVLDYDMVKQIYNQKKLKQQQQKVNKCELNQCQKEQNNQKKCNDQQINVEEDVNQNDNLDQNQDIQYFTREIRSTSIFFKNHY